MLKSVRHFNEGTLFNEDLIQNFRENDSMIEYLEDIFKALEAVEYIKYDGYEVINNEHEFPLKRQPTLPIKDSRLYLAIFHFTITMGDKVKEVKLPLYLPKLINGYYFILAGNRYYAIYQNIDSATYNTSSCVVLKSLLMPIIIKNEKKTFETIDGIKITGKTFNLNMFKRQINIFYYYFSSKGFEKTLKYFDLLDQVKLIKAENANLEKYKKSKKNYYFQLGKIGYLRVNKAVIIDKNKRNYIITLLELFRKKFDIDQVNDIQYWKIKLGSLFTTNVNNQLGKSQTILVSLKRILDNRTKKNLHIQDRDKKNIFAVIRWITQNFEILMGLNNFNLSNKRLRLSEYMVTPFTRFMSNKTYRLLNSRNLAIEKIEGIFRINPTTIISDLQSSDLLRYSNAVNDCDLFNCALKFSSRGPQSLGETSSKSISIAYRGNHPSHFGRYSLNTCSASDPGMSGCLSPFIKTYGFYYSDGDMITNYKPENIDETI